MLNELQLADDTPWKQRFRAPAIWGAQIARGAPSRGLVTSNRSGVGQLYAWDVPSGELRQLTHEPAGKASGEISPDGRFVYYLDDEQGNEIGHFARVPFEGGEIEDLTPDLPPYNSFQLALSQASNLIGFMVADAEGYHLYCLAVGIDGALGTPQRIYHSASFARGPSLAYDGTVAVVASTERSGKPQYSLLAIDTASGARLAELWDGPETSLEPGEFAPIAGDLRLLATTNRSGVRRPLIWDVRSGARIDLELPELEGDVTAWSWSPDARRILLGQFVGATPQLYTYDIQSGALARLAHPGGSFWGAFFTPGGELFALWNDAAHPPQLIALDPRSGAQTRTVLAAGEAPPGRSLRSVSFTSSDGQIVQGWLGQPDGQGPFPTIVHMIGGPGGVATNSFSPGAQAWLDHGFAFLTVNYRGCSTFGRAFEEQIFGNPGHWEVEDLVAARAWLIEQGIAHPDQVLLTGWSYGGYLTLYTLGTRPELWAGGMAGIAIADWVTQYEDSGDTLKGFMVAFFGGTPEEKPEQYAASSPITHVEQVQAPVLIIQGRNDTRCPARPVEQYEAKLRALGKPVEVVWFDAGHGSLAVEQEIEHQEIMLRFAWRVLRIK